MSILPSLSTFFLSFDVVAVRLFYFLTLEYQFLVLFCFVFPFFLKPRIYRADQFLKSRFGTSSSSLFWPIR